MATRNKLYYIPCYCLWLSVFAQAVCAETAAPSEQEENTAQTRQERFLITEEVRDRELDVEEDPLAREQSDLSEDPEEVMARPDELRLYGSVRVRYRDAGAGTFWGDGGSR